MRGSLPKLVNFYVISWISIEKILIVETQNKSQSNWGRKPILSKPSRGQEYFRAAGPWLHACYNRNWTIYLKSPNITYVKLKAVVNSLKALMILNYKILNFSHVDLRDRKCLLILTTNEIIRLTFTFKRSINYFQNYLVLRVLTEKFLTVEWN